MADLHELNYTQERRAEKLAKDLFVALASLSATEDVLVLQSALSRVISKLINNGNTISADAVSKLRDDFEAAGLLKSDNPLVQEYELFDSETDESHGKYATLDEARGASQFDRLKEYTIWYGNTRVEEGQN